MVFRPAVLIDSSDCLRFWRFKDKFIMGKVSDCSYPPGLRHLRDIVPSMNEAECPNVTPKTDIFHLRMILWLPAEKLPRTHVSPVCMRKGCNLQIGPPCVQSHVDPKAPVAWICAAILNNCYTECEYLISS